MADTVRIFGRDFRHDTSGARADDSERNAAVEDGRVRVGFGDARAA